MDDDKKKDKQQRDEEPQPRQPKKKVPHGLPEDYIEKMQRPQPWPEPPEDTEKDE
jgi:hypothetical protein